MKEKIKNQNINEINKLQKVFNQTLKLMSLYKRLNLTIPFSLKGNLGEFIIAIELLKHFPGYYLDYRGGAFPGVDIIVGNVKIQVKTSFKKHPKIFKSGTCDCEYCPTIKKSIIDEKKCNIVILVILYTNRDYSKIEKKNIYIFNQSEFKYFDTRICWSGRSKGDYTIVNVLNIDGHLPPKFGENIAFYSSRKYKKLFKQVKNNWNKIKVEELIEK